MKICSKCKKEKELSEFHKRKTTTCGYASHCKVCRSKNNKEKKYHRNIDRDQKAPNCRYNQYKSSAKQREYEWNLTYEEFMSFWQKPCYYCGDSHETIGLDRIDSSKGYILNNVVSCCTFCNRAKRDYTQEYFFDKIQKIARRHNG